MDDLAKFRREVAQFKKQYAKFQRQAEKLQVEFEKLAAKLHAHRKGINDFAEKRRIFEIERSRLAEERRRRKTSRDATRPQKRGAIWTESLVSQADRRNSSSNDEPRSRKE